MEFPLLAFPSVSFPWLSSFEPGSSSVRSTSTTIGSDVVFSRPWLAVKFRLTTPVAFVVTVKFQSPEGSGVICAMLSFSNTTFTRVSFGCAWITNPYMEIVAPSSSAEIKLRIGAA